MKKTHHLTNIDWEVRSADCSFCEGRVRIRVRKEYVTCDQVLRSDVPERRSRSHYLSNIDPIAKTAECLQCGPTMIRPQTNNGMTPWRCEFRAKQSNDWNGTYEHPDPHVRDAMREEHGPLCDSCGKPAEGLEQEGKLHYDHNHVTGKFRGWLCGRCNKGIGLLGDDLAGLLLAVEYLKVAEDVSS